MKDKELLALIDKAFDSTKEATSSWSKQTFELFEQIEAYYKKTLRKIGWPVEESKQWYSEHLSDFINSLGDDLIKHFEAGNFPLAYQEHNQFALFSEVLKELGKKKEISQEMKAIKKNIVPAFKKMKKQNEKKTTSVPLRLSHLPIGIHHFHSKKEGSIFYLKIKVELKDGQTLISYHRKGLPLAKGQWEEACEGNHPAIVEYVENEILKKEYQTPYLIIK
ncbi:MAG: hypothetical protein ABIA37_03140 [Candidatus Woesearchaeota archaeon]